MTGGAAPTDPLYAPLIVTAELPADVMAWADGLRRAHFPPERNQVRAHVTLFHALPPWLEGERAAIAAALPPLRGAARAM